MDQTSVIAESSPAVETWDDASGCDCGACSGCGVCYAGGCASPWTTRLGGLLLKRAQPNRSNLLLDNAQDPLATANDFHFEYEGGAELSIMHDHGSGICATQARFLFFAPWRSDNLNLSADSPFIATNPPTQFPGNQDITAAYWTKMFGFELNYVQPHDDHFTFIVGFRYIDLDERLSILMQNPNLPAGPTVGQITSWNTDNDLFGGQIGVDFHLDHPGLPLLRQRRGESGRLFERLRGPTPWCGRMRGWARSWGA